MKTNFDLSHWHLPQPTGTGEEAMVNVVRSYDDLSRKLWDLEGLPLTITAVQGTHPALRYTDVSLPMKVGGSMGWRVLLNCPSLSRSFLRLNSFCLFPRFFLLSP